MPCYVPTWGTIVHVIPAPKTGHLRTKHNRGPLIIFVLCAAAVLIGGYLSMYREHRYELMTARLRRKRKGDEGLIQLQIDEEAQAWSLFVVNAVFFNWGLLVGQLLRLHKHVTHDVK